MMVTTGAQFLYGFPKNEEFIKLLEIAYGT